MAESLRQPAGRQLPAGPRRRRAAQSGSLLAVTRVLIARTATESVATVNASLSQISVIVWAARRTAESFRWRPGGQPLLRAARAGDHEHVLG